MNIDQSEASSGDDTDQLGGAERDAGPEGGQEARQAIVNNTQVLNLGSKDNELFWFYTKTRPSTCRLHLSDTATVC